MIELLIGRESGTDKPRLAVYFGDKPKYLGQAGSVPKTVSRKHCKLTLEDDLTLSIEDVTNDNFLFVNGVDFKKRNGLKPGDIVELGSDHYPLDLKAIMMFFSSRQEWHIGQLKRIYDGYYQSKIDNQVRQGKLAAISALPGVLSMASMGLAFVFPRVRAIMITTAAVLALAFAVIRINNAGKNPLKMKQLEDDFRERYVCPNPFCDHFLGATPYKELLKSGCCPYCKAKFIE